MYALLSLKYILVNTEDDSREHGFDRKGGGEEGGSAWRGGFRYDTEGGSEEDGDIEAWD